MNKVASLVLLKSDTNSSRAGFTLVEILLVVAILGILAGVAVVSLKGRTKTASIAATRTSIQAIGTAIDTYEVDNGIYPASLQSLLTKGNESNWNGPYMRDGRMPKDAWGNDFSYSLQSDSYKLISAGPDGQTGSADDITN
ncbi:MAG: type II secretion system major pseudopilin GspG [bacterium]